VTGFFSVVKVEGERGKLSVCVCLAGGGESHEKRQQQDWVGRTLSLKWICRLRKRCGLTCDVVCVCVRVCVCVCVCVVFVNASVYVCVCACVCMCTFAHV